MADSTKSSSLRVGFVMHKMQVAGAEVLVERIIDRLGDAITPTVICLDGLGEIGQRLRDRGVAVSVLGRQPGIDWPLAKRLATEVRQRKIEVLHAHQYTPFFYSALARMRYRIRTKILFTEHGRHYPDIVSWKRRWGNRFLLQRYADATTACCDFSTIALREKDGFAHAITLRNGVDLSELTERDESDRLAERLTLRLSASTPYAACVARFHPVKDHATLIRGWKLVQNALPKAKLLLVGDGPERVTSERLVEELGLTQSIEFWGIRNDVAKILRAVDVFTLTSVSEAASLTLLEAMASGCAPVVTDVGGNGEHIRDGIEGRLVPRGDSEQLGLRLIELLSDRKESRQFGAAARRRIERDFDLNSVIGQYADLYRQLAGRDSDAPVTAVGASGDIAMTTSAGVAG